MNKQISIAIFGAITILAQATNAQEIIKPTPEQKKAAYDSLRKMTPEQRKAKFKAEHKRKPVALPNAEVPKPELEKKNNNTSKTTGTTAIVPVDARFPGEFEEVQAVFISWPYTYFTVPVIDTMESSPSTPLYVKLADGIQKADAKVYINVWDADDTTAVKDCMIKNGAPLTNYRFFVYQGDDIWARDFGPINYYYDTDDKLGWVDFKYYPGRNYDNVLTPKWGLELGVPVASSRIYQEGGNILADGTQNLVTSAAVYDQNTEYNRYTQARTRDSLKSNLNLSRIDVLPALPHDGGTGHVDLYVDMTDENTFVYTHLPDAMATVPGFTDYVIAGNNIDTLRKRTALSGRPYEFFNVPFPTLDDGTWYISADQYVDYTRTYSNHLIVNKSIIQPIFSDALSGNAAGDAAAIDSIKKAYPGYKIVPIDMRYLDGSGGSIHCITKEMAADNPLRFFHHAYRQLESYQSSYPVDAVITNRSGIASATLYWRIKGSGAYNSITMTAASGNHWLGNIPAGTSSSKEIFEYYISATSSNGKTITRPMPGADGPYEFWYDKTSGISERFVDGFKLGNLYPNPASDATNMEVIVTKPLQLSVTITDLMGKKVATQNFGTINATKYLNINTSLLSSGVYMINILSNDEYIASRKLIKQ